MRDDGVARLTELTHGEGMNLTCFGIQEEDSRGGTPKVIPE
jgi:hypothetical protein